MSFFLLPSLISRSSSLWIWPRFYRVNCYIAHSCTCELKQVDHKKRSSNFCVDSDAVFVNGFRVSNCLCALKLWASAVELGFEDDFSDSRDSVFVNSFSVTSSLCAQKRSASAVDLGFRYDFWYSWDSVSSTVSQSPVVYVRRRCQRQP